MTLPISLVPLKALAYNEAIVRIKYTYSNSAKFCGTLTKYSNEVKLNVNASTTITTQPTASVAYCKRCYTYSS